MWRARECKKNGYIVSKRYKWDGIQFEAWNPDYDYLGMFLTALEAFKACESHYTKQTQT